MNDREKLFFRWLGVGGVQLRWKEKVLLIDPFLTRPSLCEILFRPLKSNQGLLRSQIPRADAILITHAHYDHLMDTAEIIRQTGVIAYGSGNVVKILRAQGISEQKTVLIQNGEHLEVHPFEIEVIEGKHISIPFFSPTPLPKNIAPPQRVWDYQMDACFSFFIRKPSPSILVWHSTETKGALPADVLVVDSELSFSAFERLIDFVKPRCVIPIHWDDFLLPLTVPPKPFFRPPERTSIRIGRLHLPTYVARLQRLLPAGKVYLPTRLEEVELSSICEALERI